MGPTEQERCSAPGCGKWGSIRTIAPAPRLKDAARGPLFCFLHATMVCVAQPVAQAALSRPASAPVNREGVNRGPAQGSLL